MGVTVDDTTAVADFRVIDWTVAGDDVIISVFLSTLNERACFILLMFVLYFLFHKSRMQNKTYDVSLQ